MQPSRSSHRHWKARLLMLTAAQWARVLVLGVRWGAQEEGLEGGGFQGAAWRWRDLAVSW